MTKEQLKEIASELQTQDNRVTADPLFCVFEKERIYGMDSNYTDTWDWCNSGQQCSCDLLLRDMCESASDECRKVYYVDRDRFVNAHFTEKAALHFIKTNSHNLNQPFTYVTSLFRCYEMIGIRDALKNNCLDVIGSPNGKISISN